MLSEPDTWAFSTPFLNFSLPWTFSGVGNPSFGCALKALEFADGSDLPGGTDGIALLGGTDNSDLPGSTDLFGAPGIDTGGGIALLGAPDVGMFALDGPSKMSWTTKLFGVPLRRKRTIHGSFREPKQ